MDNELIFRIIFLVLFLLVLGIRFFYSRKTESSFTKGVSPSRWQQAAEVEGRVRTILWAASFIFVYVGVILYLIHFPFLSWMQLPFPNLLRWFGVALSFIAIPFIIWVQRTLGRHWRTTLDVSKEHRLVTSGPYSRVRHPMYTVLITFNSGLILISANLLVCVGFLIIIVLTLLRIPKEEEMMLEQFGQEYRTYMHRTGRLIPPLRRKKPESDHPGVQ